jgi:hypothetical protein
VRNLQGASRRVICDGVEQADGTIPLLDDRREHHAVVELGAGPRRDVT